MQVCAETFAGKRVWSGDATSFLYVRDQIAETLWVAPTRVLLICPGEPSTNIWTEADFKSACSSNTGKKNKLKLLFGLQPVYDETKHYIDLETSSKEIGVREVVGADGFLESWRGAGVLVSVKKTSKAYVRTCQFPMRYTVVHRIEASTNFNVVFHMRSFRSRKQGNKWTIDLGHHGILPVASSVFRTQSFIRVRPKTELTFVCRAMANPSLFSSCHWLSKQDKYTMKLCEFMRIKALVPLICNGFATQILPKTKDETHVK